MEVQKGSEIESKFEFARYQMKADTMEFIVGLSPFQSYTN